MLIKYSIRCHNTIRWQINIFIDFATICKPTIMSNLYIAKTLGISPCVNKC